MTVQQALARLLDGNDLSLDQARAGMNEVMEGEATPGDTTGDLGYNAEMRWETMAGKGLELRVGRGARWA